MNGDVAALSGELPDAELVFGFVSPLGTPVDEVQEALIAALSEHAYEVDTIVRLSRLLDDEEVLESEERPEQRQERLMTAGSQLRQNHGGDWLALMAISAINSSRSSSANGPEPAKRKAYVIRSLKHPDEVARLRHVYGKGFFLLGFSAPRRVRLETLIAKNFPRDEAIRLLHKDAAEDHKIGQQTRATFELADAYLRIHGSESVTAKVERIVDLLFSCPFHPPTREEHAMFMAYAAALRSSDLSRQVGAVVTNLAGDVIASGANDAPCPGGGTYWPATSAPFSTQRDPNAGPDYLRGFDSNERERNKILTGVITALIEGEERSEELDSAGRAKLVEKFKSRLQKTGILDLTEFGRAVHAEMAALMSCARSSVSPCGGVLYCTTFPCHNCAKHIVAAGLDSVVYVEPYPKSKAKLLHSDAISLPDEDVPETGSHNEPSSESKKVEFRAFEGIGPRRFVDLFSLVLGSGRPIRRKKKAADGARVAWSRGQSSVPRLPMDPRSYLEREDDAVEFFNNNRQQDVMISEDP